MPKDYSPHVNMFRYFTFVIQDVCHESRLNVKCILAKRCSRNKQFPISVACHVLDVLVIGSA